MEGVFLECDEVGAGGEGEVMDLEDLVGEGRGGDDERGDKAKVEAENWAIELGEGREGAMGELAELVEVSDDGKGVGPWDGVGFWFRLGLEEEEREEEGRE